MSVAFDDQGEIVPSRGVTSTSAAGAGALGRRRAVGQQPAEDVALARVGLARDLDEVPELRRDDRGPGVDGASSRFSLSSRNRESAAPPASLRTETS